MSTEKTIVPKRTYKKRSGVKANRRVKNTIAPNKTATFPTKTTVITIAPDGIITITKTEETVTEPVMTKAE